MHTRLGRLLGIVARPVGDEARALLAHNWAGLTDALRVPQQMFGRQGNGCGATIGVMPRCDFACRGCYLTGEANRVPAAPVDEIKAQMRALRPVLGHAGNLQLTDGEVTLRPVDELVELLRYARSLGLIPMLMTHGDSFRRRPGLLERLMTEGGLTEVSIHVDTTQRGRIGDGYRHAADEAALDPLRDELAAMIRGARRATRRPLRAAMTMTVTRDNLAGVPGVLRWLLRNADAFRMISFQPVAQVGRTEGGYGGGVSVDALWDVIAWGLGVRGADRVRRLAVWFGHSGCNRMVNGVVVTRGATSRFHGLRDADDATDVRVVDGFLERFGGISFRLDRAAERVARLLGVVRAAPRFVLGNLAPYALHWLRRVGDGRAARGAWRLATRAARVRPLVIVSHHFMSPAELETPDGRERLAHCVFRVPLDGNLVSMCAVNALGGRERYYAQLRRAHGPGEGTSAAGGELPARFRGPAAEGRC